MEFLIVLALLALIVLVLSTPWWRDNRQPSLSPKARSDAAESAELAAAREAKYREIRDAELDHRTGKLSDADYEAVSTALRAEAIEILHALDRGGGDQSRQGS